MSLVVRSAAALVVWALLASTAHAVTPRIMGRPMVRNPAFHGVQNTMMYTVSRHGRRDRGRRRSRGQGRLRPGGRLHHVRGRHDAMEVGVLADLRHVGHPHVDALQLRARHGLLLQSGPWAIRPARCGRSAVPCRRRRRRRRRFPRTSPTSTCSTRRWERTRRSTCSSRPRTAVQAALATRPTTT